MIFNSLPFLVFMAIFTPLFFTLKGRAQTILCLVGSYIFYGWWDYRFLSLIAFSTILDFNVAKAIQATDDEKKRRFYLMISLVVNLGFLAFFKYFNFFIESFNDAAASLGWQVHLQALHIILPVGISFYTFQTLSYTLDVYKRRLKVHDNLLDFATFVAFFPQLVAGPIVRASEFLPQIGITKYFQDKRFVSGLGRVLWGFFKKVVIADSLALFVDQCFNAPEGFSSIHLLLGVIFYSFQIYCDFSGYSDIAIGLARLLGFDFPENFRTPYFSKNFSEFWTRWHISLSSWLRDYLYIPLGGNRHGSFGSTFWLVFFGLGSFLVTGWWWLLIALIILGIINYIQIKRGGESERNAYNYMNLMVTMLLGGLWHGASWNFIFWGFLHGAYLIVQRFFEPAINKVFEITRAPRWLIVGLSILTVYCLTNIAWVFFRAPDFATANTILQRIATLGEWSWDTVINKFQVVKGVIIIGVLLVVEITNFRYNFNQAVVAKPAVRVMAFAVILWLIAFFGTFGSNSFIYFQF